MKKITFALIAALSIGIGQAHALGSNDLIGAGFSLLGQIGGAVVDKALADSPEEIEAKRLKEKAALDAKFKEAVAKIDSNKDLSPLQKEKMVRITAKQFGMMDTANNLSAQQEIEKNNQNDQMFTANGLMGAVGNAALSTPSAAIARADAAVAMGQPQSQSRAVLARYDAAQGAQNTNPTPTPAQAAQAVQATDKAPKPFISTPWFNIVIGSAPQAQPEPANVANQLQGGLDKNKAKFNAELDAAKSKEGFAVQQAVGLALQDKERKLFVEFVNGKALTEKLRAAFKDAGFSLVDEKAAADAVYQFDGEYNVASEPNRDGITEPLGALLDAPRVIEAPQVKTGMLKSAAGGLLAVFSGGQLKPPVTPSTYRQQVLIVANRHFDGKDARVSVLFDKDAATLMPDAMIDEAMRGIAGAVGVQKTVLASATPAP